ncbi:MAG: BrnT family toxin [Bdellovibrio sp.]
MKYEWDELKSEMNYKKHRVTFEEAQSVFADAIISARKTSAEEREFYEEKL